MLAPSFRALVLFGVALASAPAVRAEAGWSISSSDAKANPKNTFRATGAVFVAGGSDPKAACSVPTLPDGTYYFQVTTPSGSQLLSTDDLENLPEPDTDTGGEKFPAMEAIPVAEPESAASPAPAAEGGPRRRRTSATCPSPGSAHPQ